MKKKKKEELELTPAEKKTIYEKVFGKYKHLKGYITNTGNSPSVCIECGEPFGS